MKVATICRLCDAGAHGELHYHTPTERWRVACPACGSWAASTVRQSFWLTAAQRRFAEAERREGAERAWIDHQTELLERVGA